MLHHPYDWYNQHTTWRLTIVGLTLLSLVACTPTTTPTTAPTEALIRVPMTDTPSPLPPTATATELPPPAISFARSAASPTDPAANAISTAISKLHTLVTAEPPEEPHLINSEAVVWKLPDITCPSGTPLNLSGTPAGTPVGIQSDEVPGYRLTFVMGTRVWEFHSDNTVTELCGSYDLYDERPDIFLQLDPVAAELARLAVERVAAELDLPQARIEVRSVRPMVWEDASLGCPVNNEFYALLPVEGYQLVLIAGSRQYIFHSNSDRLMLCEGGITATPTPTATQTPTNTSTPTLTLTPSKTRTATNTPTRTASPTSTSSPTAAPTRTSTEPSPATATRSVPITPTAIPTLSP